MSHSPDGPQTGQDVLQEPRQRSSVAGTASEQTVPQFDAVKEAEITRRHTELLDKLLAMSAKDRWPYLEAAADLAARCYENDPSLTEFTCLDGEDFEDYSE